MSSSAFRIRRRGPADVPVLAAASLAQQPQSRSVPCPFPVPVEDFLHAHDAVTARTAELDRHPVEQVCRMGPASAFPAPDLLNEVGARANGCGPSELAWVSTLFVVPRREDLQSVDG